MNRLIAIPFDRFDSDKTNQGIIYNVADLDLTVWYQCWVSHKPYTDHDLHLKYISQAPSSVRNATEEFLDRMFGKGLWEMYTRFSLATTIQTERLHTNLRFHDQCASYGYDDKYGKVVIKEPNKQSSMF